MNSAYPKIQGKVLKAGEPRPEGFQYVGFCGVKQRRRVLNQMWRQLKKLARHDVYTKTAMERVTAATIEEPEPELGKLLLTLKAQEAAVQAKVPWHMAINALLDKFDELAKEGADGIQPR